ncbi:SAV_2336 N-terminal domain-related protein [Micromonospora sp. MA102]|uniref:SAV_2336 N-terminal domain-related protein n=1 Tax=Micromonospora sp. MA102 TaxID=2952755 RepID=UPI0021C85D67|nr:SAV_2336 N-terminal domain-related protein [Micromonospora sp. MA102]
MTIDRLHRAITAGGGDPTARDLAEALWLSLHLGAGAPAPAPPDPTDDPQDVAPASVEPDPPVTAGPPEPPPPDPPPPRTVSNRLYVPPASPGSVRADEIAVPRSAALSDRLGLQRALRPLMRRVPSPRERVLDEEATVRAVAEHVLADRPWPAVMVPATERWLELAVVVDTTASMTLWRELATEVVDTLSGSAAFRRVARWRLDRDGAGRAALSTWRDEARPGPELVDPSGRRVVLVVSDCVDPIWRTGAAGALLHRWARHGPVAILQPLPERMWSRTGAPTVAGLLSAPRPGSPNTDLRFDAFDGSPAPRGTIVPVLEIDAQWVGRWTRLVAGAPAVTGAVTAVTDARPTTAPVRRGQSPEPPQRVRQFRASASPDAFQLAAYVAMSEPVLPVIRYIQQAMFHRSTPSQLAEVVLSGLLRVVEARTGRYEFVDGVRPLLLDALTRPQLFRAGELLEQLSRTVQARLGVARDHFTALTPGPGRPGVAADSRPFAVINRTGLARLDRVGALPADTSTGPPDDTRAQAGPDDQDGTPGGPGDDETEGPVAASAAPADLLSPWRRVVRCTGRRRELAELRRWLDAPGPSLRVLTGGPGVGKTRLVAELLATELAGTDEELHLTLPLATGGELVVIDRAETRPGAVRRELARAARGEEVRLLLVARSTGDWWQELRRTGPTDLVHGATIDRLAPPWPAGEERQAALRDALTDLAAALDTLAGTRRWRPHAERMRLPDVGDDRYAAPISLHLTALRMLVRTFRGPAPVTAQRLLVRHLARERRYWEATAVAAQISYARPGELDEYVAAATLYGADNARDAHEVIARLRLDETADRQTLHRVANWLHELYPDGDSRYWAPLNPEDLRSEIVVPAVLAHPELVTDILADRPADQLRRAMRLLGPGCHREPRLAETIWTVVRDRPPLLLALLEQTRSRTAVPPPPLVERLRRLVTDPGTPEPVLRAVADGMPDPGVLFADQPVSVSERLVAGLRRLAGRDRYLPVLAEALARHRARLLHDGISVDVTDVLAEEVELRTRIAERAAPQSVERLGRRLAGTLDAQAEHLSRIGLAVQALSAGNRAVAQYQRLLPGTEGDLRAPLCAAEIRRARLLDDLGRTHEGFEAAHAAVAHGRDLSATRAPGGAALLNDALGTLAALHRRHGDSAAALTAENQCVRHYRDLHAADPARHAVALGRALLRQALDLDDLGTTEQALANSEETLHLVRDAATAPTVELATAHHCQALFLRRLGRQDDAAVALREVVALHRRLATAAPSRYGGDLAEVLRQQARMLAETGPVEAAIEAQTEATDVLARLFREDPTDGALRGRLVAAHRDLAELWERVGDRTSAERHRVRARLLREAAGHPTGRT